MKKALIVLIFLIAAAIAAVYIFLPASLEVRSITRIQCSQPAVIRTLQSPATWKKWFPSDSSGDTALFHNGFGVRNLSALGSAVAMDIFTRSWSVPARMIVVQSGDDSVAVEWSCKLETGFNPLARFLNYKKAVALKKRQVSWLASLAEFLDNTGNIYGIRIVHSTVKDTLLLATKQLLKTTPSVPVIYQLVGSLQKEIVRLNAVQTGDPMMHVSHPSKDSAVLMVAIPVNRPLQPPPPFLFQKMVPGNLVVSQVKGGSATVAAAAEKMDQFFLDNNKVAMAIPFETLVTDRSREPDTSAWITTLSSPVMR